MLPILFLLIFLSGVPAVPIAQPIISHSQPPVTNKEISNSYIYWQKGKALKWNDFKGKVDSSDPVHGAVTYAGIDLKIANINPFSREIIFEAYGIFDKGLSWAKPEKMDPQLLAHEQLHFDIAEVYARQLKRKLNALRLTHKDSKKIKNLQKAYMQKQQELQKKYDEETLHGIRPEIQKTWRKAIDQQLLNPERDILLALVKNEYPILKYPPSYGSRRYEGLNSIYLSIP